MTTNTEYSDLRQIIERHGGIVAQVIEPNTLVVFLERRTVNRIEKHAAVSRMLEIDSL